MALFDSPLQEVEEWVEKIDKYFHELEGLGTEYVKAQHKFFRLDKYEKGYLARLIMKAKKDSETTLSVAAATNIALASEHYKDYIENLATAKKDYLEKKNQFDILKDKFEAMRSILSMQKEAMKLV